MKLEERNKARTLRQQGLSIKEIAKTLNVATSSVSIWVRDIELTEEQIVILQNKNPIYNTQLRGHNRNKEKFHKKRLEYQQRGREQAIKKEPLHILGCSLYWAEGAKSRNCVKFSNTDPNMISIFMNFIRTYFNISEHKISLRFNFYSDNGISVEKVEDYWLGVTSLSRAALRSHTIDARPRSSKSQKKNKHIYGACTITISDVSIIQHIYGAIQAYGEFDNKNWLN